MTSVFVSGATGFIAQHVVVQLLKHNYKVVGSVRSQQKGDNLAQLLNNKAFSYEVVEDVGKKGAFDQALKNHPEVSVFLHTASPFHFNATDIEKDLLFPAVEGTKNALQAIKDHGPQINKVVVTSSFAAIGDASRANDPNYTNTEESWNEITWEEAKKNSFDGYRGSKTFAERAAWDFVAKEKPNFTINYVNPVFVFGPQAFEVKDTLNTSSEFLNKYLELTPDSEVPTMKGGYVDVRDVARAHLVAFEKGLSNQRLLLYNGRFTGQDVLDILNANLLKGKLPIGEPNSGAKAFENSSKIDNSKTKEILGFELIGLKQTVEDSISQILDVRKK